MNVEQLISIYIAISASLIIFNCVYVFVLRLNSKKLLEKTNKYDQMILKQIQNLNKGQSVSKSHKRHLCRKLKWVANLTAFDKSMENLFTQNPEYAQQYLYEICSVFAYLTRKYHSRDMIKAAYFPYIISKYEIMKNRDLTFVADFLFSLLRSNNVYARENALKALYSTGNCDYVTDALKIIDKNSSFHHSKLISDGLLSFSGDKHELANSLCNAFELYSVQMQLNIINYLRFANIRKDEKVYEILINEKQNQELRFSAIRYFEKFPVEKARATLQKLAENKDNLPWEYQSIASSALKAYPDQRTEEILKTNLSSPNWHVRLNSALSFESIGYSYEELITLFDINDKYAVEILKYCFDRKIAEKEVKTI